MTGGVSLGALYVCLCACVCTCLSMSSVDPVHSATAITQECSGQLPNIKAGGNGLAEGSGGGTAGMNYYSLARAYQQRNCLTYWKSRD